MLKTKEEIKETKKIVIKKALKYAKDENEEFITFLEEHIENLRDNKQDIPKGLRKMIRELKKKPLLLTKASLEDKKWALEFFRDYEMYDNEDELIVINQMLVDPNRLDPDYDGVKQDWQYLQIEQESRIERVNAKEKKLDQIRLITEEDTK